MQIKSYKTHRVSTQDNLIALIDEYIPKLQERSILAITSKIVSLCEGSVIEKEKVDSKEMLIRKSADAYLDCKIPSPYGIHLTIKNNLLIPSAGIDESNGEGVYILYPENIQHTAASVWEHIRRRDHLNEAGLIITDSHTTPLRRGVIGIGLGYCGFNPLYNYIGKPDCFGTPMRVTMANHLDALSVAAVFCMGEGNEQTPFAVITEAPHVAFQPVPPSEEEVGKLSIPMDEDLYAPLLKNAPWVYH